jgi:hypothetical protein
VRLDPIRGAFFQKALKAQAKFAGTYDGRYELMSEPDLEAEMHHRVTEHNQSVRETREGDLWNFVFRNDRGEIVCESPDVDRHKAIIEWLKQDDIAVLVEEISGGKLGRA